MTSYDIGLTDRQGLIAHLTAAELTAIALGEDENGWDEFGVTPKDAIKVLTVRTRDVNGKRSRVRIATRALATIRKANA